MGKDKFFDPPCEAEGDEMRPSIFKNFLLLAMLASAVSCGRIQIIRTDKDALSSAEHVRLASIYESKGEHDLALREYEKAALSDRNNPKIYLNMANIRLNMKMYREAEADFLKASELDPVNPSVYNNLGWLYMETDRLDKAEEAAKKALSLDPKGGYVYLDTIGVIQMKRDNTEEAEKSLKEAASLAPPEEKRGLLEIYNHLLELYRKTGDKEKQAQVEDRIKGL